MTKKQALNYLRSSGFSEEQIKAVVDALQEPTTKNDLALIHTEGLDEEIRCTMCTNTMKSDRGCDGSCVVNKGMYKAVMDAIEKRIQLTTKNDLSSGLENASPFIDWNNCHTSEQLDSISTTKNDLGVDCISRAEVLKLMKDNWHTHNGDWAMQESMDDIRALPSVTPIRPKGHWIKIGDRGFGYSDIVICKCSECEYQTEFVGKFDGHNLVIDAERADNYCSNCGSDNREVVEE